MSSSNRTEQSKSERYFQWFDRNLTFLWSFAHFNSTSNAEYTDELLYILHSSRAKIAQTIHKSGSLDEATAEFLAAWFKKLKRPKAHPALQSFELSWEDQFLLFSMLKRKLSLGVVSRLLRKSEASVRYGLFSALAKQAHVSEVQLRCGQRDCIRNDLFFVDLLLDEHWKDPLHLVSRSALETHARNCSRCYQLSEKLKIEADRVKSKSLQLAPDEFKGHVHGEMGTRWKRFIRGEWFGSFPLWAKLPLQLILVIVSIALVLNSARFSFSTQQSEGQWGLKISQIQSRVMTWFDAFDFKSLKTSSESTQSSDSNGALANYGQSKETLSSKTDSIFVDPAKSLGLFLTEKKIVALKETDKKITPSIEAHVTPVTVANQAAAVKPAPVLPSVPATLPVTQAPVLTAAPIATPSVLAVPAQATEKVFYRWGAFSKNLDADSLKIKKFLEKFGAKMAGELELGANYRGGKYFHFSIAKKDFDLLLKESKDLGLIEFRSNRAESDKATPVDQSRIVFLLLPHFPAHEAHSGPTSQDTPTSTQPKDSKAP